MLGSPRHQAGLGATGPPATPEGTPLHPTLHLTHCRFISRQGQVTLKPPAHTSMGELAPSQLRACLVWGEAQLEEGGSPTVPS